MTKRQNLDILYYDILTVSFCWDSVPSLPKIWLTLVDLVGHGEGQAAGEEEEGEEDSHVAVGDQKYLLLVSCWPTLL